MSYERDLSAIFGKKAEGFTDHHKELLERVWECGRREGVYEAHGHARGFLRAAPRPEGDAEPEVPREALLQQVLDHGHRDGHQRAHEEMARFIQSYPYTEEDPKPEMPRFEPDQYTPEMIALFSQLWARVFNEGAARGQDRLGILFTHVLSRMPLQEVIEDTVSDGHGNVSVQLHQWVYQAFQAIIDAPDLDAAEEVAKECRRRREGRSGFHERQHHPEPRYRNSRAEQDDGLVEW